ncbi:MAG: transporter substrate-binding domain-containing protein, partial [Desulfuromonadales bacterium]|nr:transporter substrate-binding domain-containing protein [Desulfuromonadales bacterium]
LFVHPESAPAEAPQLTPARAAAVIQSATEYDYPPYCLLDAKGQPDGFSVELLRASLQAMGREVSFKLGPWSEVRQMLAAGEVQVLPLVGRTPEREQLFDFTFPYLTMHGTIVIRDGEMGIRTLGNLAGRQVAVMRGDNAEEFVRRSNLGATVVTTATFEEALRELSEGRHDAVIVQRLVALQLMRQGRLSNLRVVGPPLTEFVQSFCFAVGEGDKQLLSLLNEGLSLVIADGTFRRLHAKWFGPLEAGQKERSRIVVGGDSEYPPFEYLDENGEPAGYNVELTRAIARQMGLEVTFRLGPWGEIREALARDEIDVVQGMFYSPERERTFGFTPAHAVVNHAIVVRANSEIPGSLSALGGKSILVMQGDIMHDAAVELGYGDQLVLVASQEEALAQLAAGEHDCALVATIPAYYWIAKRGWKNLRVADFSVRSPDYCYAVPEKNQRLLALLSEGLANLKATGEYRQIYAKWLGVYENQALPLREILRLSFWIVIPILLLLLGTSLWSWTLRRTVRRRTADLRQEVAERQKREAEIRAKNAELDDYNAELERFTYTVSHDLRSPLVTFKTFLGFLEKDLETGNQERVGKDLYYMHMAADRMGRLLTDLLQIAQVGRVASTREQVSFCQVVDEALTILAGPVAEHGVQVQVADVPLTLLGERSRLVELWQNLIDNAIKYRSPDTIPEIRVGVEQTPEGPIFQVGDNGIGIDPRYREKIFGLFDQLNREAQGSGLGLALVKRIVELNKGRIWVESEGCGKGSRFRFTLPAAVSEGGVEQ